MRNPASLFPLSRMHRLPPFLAWSHELRDPQVLRADLLAGITVALVLIPQSMAYAQLAGLPAYYGLYAAFLPPILAALWGSSRQLATGPVAMVSLMTGAALAPIAAAGGDVVAAAILCAVLAGGLQLGLGLLHLGAVVNFLSHPVLIGLTNAAALVIATSQLDKLLGVRADKAAMQYETVWNVCCAAARGVHWPALGMAALAFAIMIASRRLDRRLPGVLLAVVATTVLSWWSGYHDEARPQAAALRGGAAVVAGELLAERAEAGRLADEERTARQAASRLRSELGPVDARGVEARLHAEVLGLKREEAERDAERHLAALRAMRFRRSATQGAIEYWPVGELPEEQALGRREWRLRGLDAAGALMVAGGSVVGAIPAGLPAPRLPDFSWSALREVLGPSILLALIGFVEAISIAKAMAMRTRHRIDANQELIGQGLANLAGAACQAYPVSGSFSRSAVNLAAGACTGFAAVVTGAAVILALLFLTPLLHHLPEATLAAVIVMAVAGLVKVAPVIHMWKANRGDGLIALLTFAVTLAAAPHLDLGILVGVGASLVAYLMLTMRPRVALLGRHGDGSLRDCATHGLAECEHILALRFDGRLYFANTGHLEDALISHLAGKPTVKAVVLMAQGINSIDASGEEALSEITSRLDRQGIRLLLCGAKQPVRDLLDRAGYTGRFGADRFKATELEALDAAWAAVGCDHRGDCPLLRPRISGRPPCPATHPTPLPD